MPNFHVLLKIVFSKPSFILPDLLVSFYNQIHRASVLFFPKKSRKVSEEFKVFFFCLLVFNCLWCRLTVCINQCCLRCFQRLWAKCPKLLCWQQFLRKNHLMRSAHASFNLLFSWSLEYLCNGQKSKKSGCFVKLTVSGQQNGQIKLLSKKV